jgi:uncharacterized protein involved in propanediol utilization
MSRVLGHPVDVAAVTSSVASAFADVFQITWIVQSGISIESADRLAMGRATRTSERRRDDMEDVHA